MFASKSTGTVIAKGLKIVGSVTAEGLVEVHGHIEGELHGTSLVIARGASVVGTMIAQKIVVDGNVEGPIEGGDVILKSHANVTGDIKHQSLSIENGAVFEGCSKRATERLQIGEDVKKSEGGRSREKLAAAE